MEFDIIQQIFSAIFTEPAEGELVKSNKYPKSFYYIIHGSHGPRWILPENPAAGLPVISQWRPYSKASQIKWLGIIFAYRLGMIAKIPGVIRCKCVLSRYIDSQYVPGEPDQTEFLPVIYIGTPGSTRKAVASLVKVSNAKIVAIVKIPLGPSAKNSILHEANILSQITTEAPALAPDILYVDYNQGVTSQQAVAGKLSDTRLLDEHIQWLLSLRTGKVTSLKFHSSLLQEQLKDISDSHVAEKKLIQQLLNNIADPSVLPAVWLHGDFVPWNLKLTSHGLRAIDWENAEKNALPLLDLAHFFVTQDYLLGSQRNRLEYFFNNSLVAKYCRHLNISDSVAKKIMFYYLSSSWIKKTIEKEDRYSIFLLSTIKTLKTIQS